MNVLTAAVLAGVSLAGGIIFLRMGIKNKRQLWKITGVALFLVCVLCIVYLIATLLLLGGIE